MALLASSRCNILNFAAMVLSTQLCHLLQLEEALANLPVRQLSLSEEFWCCRIAPNLVPRHSPLMPLNEDFRFCQRDGALTTVSFSEQFNTSAALLIK